MKKALFILLIFVAACAFAQDSELEDYINRTDPYSIDYSNLPETEIKHYNLELMRGFYPLYYQNEYKIRSDVRYVTRQDSAFIALWDSVGNAVLKNISDLSGIEWVENRLDIRIVRYLPTIGLYSPLVMPWEGIKTRDYTEGAPTGLRRFLNLIRLLCGRNLKQVNYPECSWYYLHDHPLLQPSAYRFDNMAMTLTLAVAPNFIPPDSLRIIVSSDSWHRSFAGWTVFDDYFRNNWTISTDTTLAQNLANESYNSPLVELSMPPRQTRAERQQQSSKKEPIKLHAGGGRLGFSVVKTNSGLLEVADVDSTKIAYASGLMPGDVIKRVNGEIVRTARDLMGTILDKIDEEGVYMIVLRDGDETGVLLLPPSDF